MAGPARLVPDWDAEVGEVRRWATRRSSRDRGHGGESGAPIDETMWHLADWRNGQMVRLSSPDSELKPSKPPGGRRFRRQQAGASFNWPGRTGLDVELEESVRHPSMACSAQHFDEPAPDRLVEERKAG